MESIWQQLKSLFEADDGSLPDIYIEPLSDQDLKEAYNYIRTVSSPPRDATLWSIKEAQDVLITEIEDPARSFIAGDIELFRHALNDLKIDGVSIPKLTVEVSEKQISLDYKPGSDWGPEQLSALFRFLKNIQQIAPKARVFQADEGCYDKPNESFEEAFNQWLRNAS